MLGLERAPRREPLAPSRRELGLSLLLSLVVAAIPLGGPLLDPGRVASALDTTSYQLPWRAVLDLPPGSGPANPDLADQAVQHYPLHRWVVQSWLGGDPPTWNPGIYAGTPGIGNAQAGALDPQVLLLVLLEALGGLALFQWGIGLTAWLRLGLALAGAYALARRLGLPRPGALLASAAFGFSGYLVLWLHSPLGHVPPFLPWTLFFLEGLRGPRPARAFLGVAGAFALAILGGHLETAFYVGVAAGAWALAPWRSDRERALRGLAALVLGTGLGACLLLPAAQYVLLSGARLARAPEALSARVDLLALGVLLSVLGLGILLVRLQRDADGSRASRMRIGLAAGALLVALLGAARFFVAHGLGPQAALALVPDRWGHPDAGGYRGEGNYIEAASAWVAAPVLAFALAALLSPRGRLVRRRLVGGLAALAFLLAIGLPGLHELYRFVPLVGLGATVRFASVGSLLLGLLAGEGLHDATRGARLGACLLLVPLFGLALFPSGAEPLELEAGSPAPADLLGVALHPERELAGEDSAFEVWVHPELRFATAAVRVDQLDARGAELRPFGSMPLEVFDAPSARARQEAPDVVAAAPAGARWLRPGLPLLTNLLGQGHWRFTVDFFAAPGDVEPVASATTGYATVHRRVDRRPTTLAFLGLALLALVLVPATPAPGLALLVGLLALAQGLWFERGVNPSVPRSWVFPETETERLLAEELGPGRFFADLEVLPPNTGLVRGLRSVDGYDAVDVGSFNEYRLAFLPARNPLLAWNPRGFDLQHPLFRLLGVTHLVLKGPFEHPGWELVASPGGPRRAETWIYRARDPVPRAFCVASLGTLDELAALLRRDTTAFDPLAFASIDGDWRPAAPFTRADVGVPEWTNGEVRLRASLDGDGLLVLTEQAYPGWTVEVDGEPRELHTVDLIFRGVALGAGEHEVVFRFRSTPLRLGVVVSLASLAASLAAAFLLRAQRSPAPAS